MLRKDLSLHYCMIMNILYKAGTLEDKELEKKEWINKNYNFSYISNFIDELIILDISNKNIKKFLNSCKYISDKVFVPMSFGGGINTVGICRAIFSKWCG